jgi:hypothetical protein
MRYPFHILRCATEQSRQAEYVRYDGANATSTLSPCRISQVNSERQPCAADQPKTSHSTDHQHPRTAPHGARGRLRTGKKYEQLSGQMRHVEAVIKMLVPACNLARITVKRRQPNLVQARHPLGERWTCCRRLPGHDNGGDRRILPQGRG